MEKLAEKLIVANRGEIACRIFQGAKEMGLTTVALAVEGDEQARHITVADEVYFIDRYLNADAVIAAALKAKAKYIHPGYGFLSERPHFVREAEKAGLVFLGPRAETMESLGGKIAAKELAEKLGIPTIPWARIHQGQDLLTEAKKIGFPLLLKAQSGGGGKGMRKVASIAEVVEAAESASNEAQAAFGDATLFLEKLLINPRHIEVQVFGDGNGNGVHLFERECTLQRRHQKILEEACAPNLKDSTRQGLFDCALKLVKETKYRSAGTIEFLVDAEENFYFIEMNTRLQVEHPVTELVTGLDLVHEQIKLAMNPSGYKCIQVDKPRGHAIEVRICAENPDQDFAPCTGTIQKLIWPMGAGIRIDSGIEEGQTIGTSFDSMLAKLIVYAPDRPTAIRRLQFALRETIISGIGTNIGVLERLAHNPDVIAGKVDTEYLGRHDLSSPKFDVATNNEVLTLIQNSAAWGKQSSVKGSEHVLSPWSTVFKGSTTGGGNL